MTEFAQTSWLRRFIREYGMVFILLLLVAYYSYATIERHYPTGADAARLVTERVAEQLEGQARILVAAHPGPDGEEFARKAAGQLRRAGFEIAGLVQGEPADLRRELGRIADDGTTLDAMVVTRNAGQWRLLDMISDQFPSLDGVAFFSAESYLWPDFLTHSNLVAIADRIVVIALIAIGMTMVIITGGIDLSVGSLVALSAVVTTVFIRDAMGGVDASGWGVILGCLVGAAACGVVGMFSGMMVTVFSIPPFIVTLAMMQVARGLAFLLAGGESVYHVPATIEWLGRGRTFGVPHTVGLMIVLYAAAYVLMNKSVLGRYIYAVGGNIEAARLSGVPVRLVTLFVYAACGLLAGLGGVVQASQLQSGAPTYGVMYELYVIAAVVVGGTSLSGGRGNIMGTLIGAFIIAVIQNGMNLTGVESYTQKVVLGGVILAAVLLDIQRRQDFSILQKLRGLWSRK